jgi:PST family polysaccharide transporter
LGAVISHLLRGQLARNALSLYAVQGLNFLVPLILLPYLLRILGPDGYGSIVFAQALIGYLIMLTDFGFNLTAARDISVARDNPEQIAQIYWTTQAAKALLLLLSVTIICATVGTVPRLRKEWAMFLACGVLLIGSGIFPTWYFQGLERLTDTAIIQAVSKCVVTTSIFVFVRSPQQKLLAAFFMSSPQLIGLFVAIALGYPAAPASFYRPTFTDIGRALKGSFHMFLSTVSSSLYLNTNAFVLGLVAGERAVAYYSVGNRLIWALASLASPVTQAIYPRASLLFESQPKQAWQLIRRVSLLILPALGLASLLAMIFAPFIVHIIAGASYSQAISVLRIMAPVPLLMTAAGLLGQTIMVNLRLTRYLWRIYVAVGLLNLAILPALVYFWAANGAALSLTLAEALGPALMIAVIWSRNARST